MIPSSRARSFCLPTSVLVLCFVGGCFRPNEIQPSAELSNEEFEVLVRNFCGDCHASPDPQSFAKRNWPAEVERGFEFYEKSGRADLTKPDQVKTTEYYQKLAPESLSLPAASEDLESSPVRFTRLQIPTNSARPGVADINTTDRGFWFTDMGTGEVGRVEFDDRVPKLEILATMSNPAHVEPYERNSKQKNRSESGSFLVGDLGSFAPADHDLGKLVLYEGNRTIDLLENLGRVSDFAIGDYDNDGISDLVVAEFGWHDTGGLHLLYGTDTQEGADLEHTNSFRHVRLADAHGFSHVLATDINADEALDIVALQSQEYERVLVFLNDGAGNLSSETIYAASIPDYGCSCIDLVDIDGDSDVDVLLSNGDSMDSLLLKPHHSIQWLENTGNLNFEHHSISQLPGAYGVTSADLDQDGDQDIVACTMTWWDDVPFNTVVWFEQIASHEFRRHNLDLSLGQHACLDVGDFDHDGKIDLAVGEFSKDNPNETWMTVWWNEGSGKSHVN